MAKVNQLKNQARREEQRENWSRAIELYTQALDASRRESQGFADLSLYNRIGDIYLRIGQKNTAVRYYEQAIELYAEQDLHTSAIALCNKVLRILPDRSTVFLQLGRLNLATNLVAQGREHYHRYATAMRKRGSEEAALEGLEELIAATGDANTLTLWAGWLAEASDVEGALKRVEKFREPLEKHGIDPAEVARQVRSKAVVGFEGKGGEARAADPLAGAFLTLGDDAPARRGPAKDVAGTGEPGAGDDAAIDVERTGPREVAGLEADAGAVADETGAPAAESRVHDTERPEPPIADEVAPDIGDDTAFPGDELVEADTAALPGDAELETEELDGAHGPIPREPGSVPWEQEVEEIIAEFDLAFDEPWTEVSPEPEDPAVEPGRAARSRPDAEANEAETGTWSHTAPRPPQVAEAVELDEFDAVTAHTTPVGAIEEEDDEGALRRGPGDRTAGDRVAPETAEPSDHAAAAPRLEDVDDERPEPLDAVPRVGEAREAVGEEPAEESSGLETEGLEVGFDTGADDLESIVHAAAALGDGAGFDAEPVVVADEVPEPEPEEPSETDAESAVPPESDAGLAALEPSDVETPEPGDESTFDSIEGLAESLASLDDAAAVETEPLSMEADEDASADDAGWIDDVRRTLDEHARTQDEEAEASTPEGADRDTAPETETWHAGDGAFDGDADLEAETIAVEWTPDDDDATADRAGETVAEQAPVPPTDETREPEPDRVEAHETVEPEPEAVEPEPEAVEPEPEAVEPESEAVEPEPAAAPATGRSGNGSRPDRAQDTDDERAPLAEPRLTVEEDPEDAFRDWVESASTGVLKRALSELENRREHERALAVLERLTELEEPEVEFRNRHVEYLESLGRTREAVDACLALAEILEVEGRVSEARDAYRRTRKLDPGEDRALEGLTRLEGLEQDSQGESVRGAGPKKPYMPDNVNGTDLGSVIDRPMPSISVPRDERGAGPRPYSGVAGGSEAGTDFEQLLSEFRAELHEKPARNDSSSRTELGARLKEMGRLDDAIRELQAAVREPSAPPLAFELLGEAFLEKGQPRIAVRFLEKALGSLSQGDRDILGVLYQLGIAYESLSDASKALICYERIFSVDIDYRDIQERILSCSS